MVIDILEISLASSFHVLVTGVAAYDVINDTGVCGVIDDTDVDAVIDGAGVDAVIDDAGVDAVGPSATGVYGERSDTRDSFLPCLLPQRRTELERLGGSPQVANRKPALHGARGSVLLLIRHVTGLLVRILPLSEVRGPSEVRQREGLAESSRFVRFYRQLVESGRVRLHSSVVVFDETFR